MLWGSEYILQFVIEAPRDVARGPRKSNGKLDHWQVSRHSRVRGSGANRDEMSQTEVACQ